MSDIVIALFSFISCSTRIDSKQFAESGAGMEKMAITKLVSKYRTDNTYLKVVGGGACSGKNIAHNVGERRKL